MKHATMKSWVINGAFVAVCWLQLFNDLNLADRFPADFSTRLILGLAVGGLGSLGVLTWRIRQRHPGFSRELLAGVIAYPAVTALTLAIAGHTGHLTWLTAYSWGIAVFFAWILTLSYPATRPRQAANPAHHDPSAP